MSHPAAMPPVPAPQVRPPRTRIRTEAERKEERAAENLRNANQDRRHGGLEIRLRSLRAVEGKREGEESDECLHRL